MWGSLCPKEPPSPELEKGWSQALMILLYLVGKCPLAGEERPEILRRGGFFKSSEQKF